MQKNRYDAEGLRVEKEESGTIFRYIYDRGELFAVEEQKASQTSQRQIIRGHQVLGSRDTKGNLCYYHQNEQGSTQTITNEKQEVKSCYLYEAFGGILEASEPIESEILYTGQQYDKATNPYYLRSRYYQPKVGRFLQEDSYLGDGWNLYAYCRNNPLSYYDPSGYDAEINSVNQKNPKPRTIVKIGDEEYPLAMELNLQFFAENNKKGNKKPSKERDYEKTGGTEGGSKSSFDNEIPRSGTEWNEYFKKKYGADNVRWNINSVDDIFSDPTRLKSYTADELQTVLGNDWTRGVYGSNGGGWKLMNGDISIFYHPGGGKHGGSYYGISSGATGKIKVINSKTYIPLKGDKATVIYD